MSEENKEECGKCLFWSMWTGVCFNHKSGHLYEEVDFDAEPCGEFEWEESYKPKDDGTDSSSEHKQQEG